MKYLASLGILAGTALATALPASAGLFFFGGPTVSAPEIDGAAGIAVLAILTSVGLIAYDRFRR